MKKTLSLFALLTLLVFNSTAAQASPFGDFGVDGGINWGLGSVHNSSGSVAGRTVNAIALNAFPNYKYAGIQFGIIGELRFIGQNTDPATVSNSNVKGTSWLMGIGAEYQILLWTFSAGFDFLGNYSLSETTASGSAVSYKKPIGFMLKAGISPGYLAIDTRDSKRR